MFSFATPQIVAPAGRITKTRLSVTANPPRIGEEASRPFSVVAADGTSETEASGTFVQITSDLPIKRAKPRHAGNPQTAQQRAAARPAPGTKTTPSG